MSVQHLPFDLQINSAADIEQALSSEQDKQIISDYLKKHKLYEYDIDQATGFLDTQKLFKVAYCGSKSLFCAPDRAAEMVGKVDRYQALLQRSVQYTSSLTPLFVKAFKCHQLAIDYEVAGEKKNADLAMMKTGELGKEIATKYEALHKEYEDLRDEIIKIMHDLTKDHVEICAKQQEFNGKQANDENSIDSIEKLHLDATKHSLDSSMKALWEIQTALLNLRSFWGTMQRYSTSLTNTDLVDPFMIDLMRSEIFGSKATTEFDQTVKDCCPQGIKKLLPFNKSLEEAFEKSNFDWLILAKTNQIMGSAIQEAARAATEMQNDITRINEIH